MQKGIFLSASKKLLGPPIKNAKKYLAHNFLHAGQRKTPVKTEKNASQNKFLAILVEKNEFTQKLLKKAIKAS